jgi:hypothetical protein
MKGFSSEEEKAIGLFPEGVLGAPVNMKMPSAI